jgi:glycosyltransferase involved in cell wall biosynthesis
MNNKKRLLIVNGNQFGYSSGHYFYCKYLTSTFRISYICFDRGLNKLEIEGVDVCYVSFSGNKLIRNLRFLRNCIRQSLDFKPHILFVTYFNLCFLLSIFCRSGEAVLDIRSGSLNENIFSRRFENLIILIQSLFFKHIIFLSESLKNKLAISSKKSIILPLGSEIYFAGNHIFNTIKLLYVGSLDNRNISETINGIHWFLQTNNSDTISLSYTIIGFGSESEILKIHKCISERKLTKTVTFIGRKTHNELRPYFEQANVGIVFVPQTQGYDKQPATKLFEYLLAGMPVIATNTYENRLIVNDRNGVLINDTAEDFCNGLAKIYRILNFYNSSEIRKSVESYTWENIVNTNLKPFLLELVK